MKSNYLSLKEQISNMLFLVKSLFVVNKRIFWIRIPLIILQTLSSITSIWFLKRILNEISNGADVKNVVILASFMAGFSFLVSLISKIIMAFDNKEMLKTEYGFKLMLAESIMSLPYKDAVEPETLNFLEMAKTDNSFSTVLSSLTGFVSTIITSITYAAAVAFINPIILIIIIINSIIDAVILRKKAKNDFVEQNERVPVFRKMWAIFNILDFKEYGKEVRVNRLKEWAIRKGKEQNKESLKIVKKGTRKDQILSGLQELASIIMTTATYLILSFLLIVNRIMIGDFTYVLNCMLNLSGSIKGIITSWNTLLNHGLFSRGFRYCINLSKNRNNDFNNSNLIDAASINECSIEFKNVTFTYPGADRPAIKNISFFINNGERLSIVGVNGSGKTTLVLLLCGFYKPDEGEILIGGVPISNISYETYCKILGIAFQNSQFFSGSIAENITLCEKIDNDRINYCLKMSDIYNKITNLPNGINTTLGREFDESGIDFSGGELQKLSISRVLYYDPKIMVFDEPTASLDPISEHEIINSMRKVTKNVTSIIISHRLSSAKSSDKIAVLSEGELVEFGSHSELINRTNGLYHKLFSAQSQYYV